MTQPKSKKYRHRASGDDIVPTFIKYYFKIRTERSRNGFVDDTIKWIDIFYEYGLGISMPLEQFHAEWEELPND
jgi:hypothetical protein